MFYRRVFAVFCLFLPLARCEDALFCEAECIAGCLSNVTESPCSLLCGESGKPDCNLNRGQNGALKAENLTLVYVQPTRALAEWDSLDPETVFVLEYREHQMDPWSSKLVLNRSLEIHKQPCTQLYVRLTPVSREGVGVTSETVHVAEPTIPRIDLKRKNTTMVNTSHYEVVFSYSVPEGFNSILSDVKLTRLPGPEACTGFKFSPKTDLENQEVRASMDRPDCSALVVVNSVTACGVLQPPVKSGSVSLYLSCADFNNCGVVKCGATDYCNLDFLWPNLTSAEMCQPAVNFTFSWSPVAHKTDAYVNCAPRVFLILVKILDQDSKVLSNYTIRRVGTANLEHHMTEVPTDAAKVTAQGCEIFDQSKKLLQSVREKRLPYASVYIFKEFQQRISNKSCEIERQQIPGAGFDAAKIVAPLGVAVAVLVLVVVVVYRKNLKERKKLRKIQSSIYSDKSNAMQDIDDKWEIDRRFVQVFDDEILGKGAFGKVYKAKILGTVFTSDSAVSPITPVQETATNMIVAAKVCHEIADDATKQDFRQEIELMKDLYTHPKLVNILYCITRTEPLTLIVEYCASGDLLNFLRHTIRKYMNELQDKGIDLESEEVDHSRVMSYKDVLSVCFQVADGMMYISSKGYIHRDLAARNVLVCERLNTVKIGDFGLCRYVESDAYMTKGGKLPIKWLALEAIERWEFSVASDVWAFGILIYEVLTLGDAPYPDILPEGDVRQTMLRFLSNGGRMAQPMNCSDELYEVMSSTWKAEPSDRPSFDSLKETLRQMLSDLDDVGEYGDYYVTPNRNYYNDSVLDEKEMLDLPEDRFPSERSLASRTSGPLILPEEQEDRV